MSLAIYYVAHREPPLSVAEVATVDELLARYAGEDRIEEYRSAGEGLNWESFCTLDSSEPGVIFEGATKLPDNSPEAGWLGLQHWCRPLSEIRRALPGASWRVHVEDHAIYWNRERNAHDPSV